MASSITTSKRPVGSGGLVPPIFTGNVLQAFYIVDFIPRGAGSTWQRGLLPSALTPWGQRGQHSALVDLFKAILCSVS